MRQADQVITTVLRGLQMVDSCPEGAAKIILDSLHSAGFHISEPSEQVFNAIDPVVIEDARVAMGAIIGYGSVKEGTAAAAYEHAELMKAEREKRYAS